MHLPPQLYVRQPRSARPQKDKEPKTAKASGICALVSFIINMILIVVIFLFMSFVASKSTELINNTIDKAAAEAVAFLNKVLLI